MYLERVTESFTGTKRMEKRIPTCVLRLVLLVRHDDCEEESSKNTWKICSCVPLRLKRNPSHIDVCFVSSTWNNFKYILYMYIFILLYHSRLCSGKGYLNGLTYTASVRERRSMERCKNECGDVTPNRTVRWCKNEFSRRKGVCCLLWFIRFLRTFLIHVHFLQIW